MLNFVKCTSEDVKKCAELLGGQFTVNEYGLKCSADLFPRCLDIR